MSQWGKKLIFFSPRKDSPPVWTRNEAVSTLLWLERILGIPEGASG